MSQPIAQPASTAPLHIHDANTVVILPILETQEWSEEHTLLQALASFVLDHLAKLFPIIVEPFQTVAELASYNLDRIPPTRRLVVPWRLSPTSENRPDGEDLLTLLLSTSTLTQGTTHSLALPLSVTFLRSNPENFAQSPVQLELLTNAIPGWDSRCTVWKSNTDSSTLFLLRSFKLAPPCFTLSAELLSRHATALQLALQEDATIPVSRQLDQRDGRLYLQYLAVLLQSTLLRYNTWFREFNLSASRPAPQHGQKDGIERSEERS
jgi:hypothetical protein